MAFWTGWMALWRVRPTGKTRETDCLVASASASLADLRKKPFAWGGSAGSRKQPVAEHRLALRRGLDSPRKAIAWHCFALRRGHYPASSDFAGRGAKGGTRTRTGVTRWNLNPVRLPIPPLSQVPLILTRPAAAQRGVPQITCLYGAVDCPPPRDKARGGGIAGLWWRRTTQDRGPRPSQMGKVPMGHHTGIRQ